MGQILTYQAMSYENGAVLSNSFIALTKTISGQWAISSRWFLTQKRCWSILCYGRFDTHSYPEWLPLIQQRCWPILYYETFVTPNHPEWVAFGIAQVLVNPVLWGFDTSIKLAWMRGFWYRKAVGQSCIMEDLTSLLHNFDVFLLEILSPGKEFWQIYSVKCQFPNLFPNPSSP